MKIIADLPEYVITQIRSLVKQGQYPSISAFILTAVENQITLETLETDGTGGKKGEILSNAKKLSIDYSFPLSDFPLAETEKTEKTTNLWEAWMWGQINRLLPIKFAVRYLAMRIAQEKNFREKDNFNQDLGEAARSFGKFLEDQDSKLNKPRDQKLSTGFPVGKDSQKSIQRYWSQFVGYEKSDGTKTGALFDLALANMTQQEDGTLVIGLTKQGKLFAQIPNPVIDEHNFASSLAPEEKKFYIKHILKNIPGEVSLFHTLLKLLQDGINRREEMNKELAEILEKSGWSDGLISTQRAGAISRMYELHLISKEKDGLEVRYKITQQGREFLEKTHEKH